jgi:UDP-glucose 4-epimerase
MASDAGGESLNIVSGVDTSLNKLVGILLEQCASSLKPIYRNDPAKTRLTASPLLGFRRDGAEAVLGWAPRVGIEEGIARLIAWRERIDVH